MRARVFSIDIVNRLGNGYIAFYRTNGTGTGGGLRFYKLTTDRLCRVLDAMVRVSCNQKCNAYAHDGYSIWSIKGLARWMRDLAGAEDDRLARAN